MAALTRSVHDLTAAAWFGGSLMGAVGLNGAAAAAKDPTERARLSALGWKKWAPVQAAAIGLHFLSGLALIGDNKVRVSEQEGVGRLTAYKTAVTVLAAVVTLYSGILGGKVGKLSHEGSQGATEPREDASKELKSAQLQLKVLQWSIPALSGAVIVMGAQHGEMQRPARVLKGLKKK
ncbi:MULTISPECIES: hypothetical protein [unclassified Arthrobacter]|uniref:hypothetical protein n=1 Tax=unclassified Arthrobacter TaxID=235627 RepID=UPI001E2FE0AF|nr:MULTISPECIES: hypothetical protein [unclassified Arthrobacter]MCC9146031.1 hypothetical protein [Arthrobacter sp. zg-Y919]MDK1277260.1 hypothetical protein [Arthrobacter sp. zg.Y919]WIB03772.1 hypothetical protein QNO10_03575 [Arthrobacter sp. zg-Y919]